MQCREFFTSRTALNRLITINIAIYILMLIGNLLLSVLSFLMVNDYSNVLLNWLAFPVDLSLFITRPYTILTSLFVHSGLWHLVFNMLMLYVSGKIFMQYLSEKQLYCTYLFGGVLGNLFFMLSYHLFPVFHNVISTASGIGASGAIMAILFTIAIYRPKEELQLWLVGRVRLWILAVVFVILDIIQIPIGNAGGHFAHIGGAIYGLLFALYLIYKSKRHYTIFEKSKKKYAYAQRTFTDEEFNQQKHNNEKRVDAILDKIAKNGYDALSKEEKDFLYHYKR